MALNLISPSTFTTAILIGDTTTGVSANNLPMLTQFMGSPVSAALEIQSNDGTLLLPRLTPGEIASLNAVSGMMAYNSVDNAVTANINGTWLDLAAGPDVMSFRWNVALLSQTMAVDNGYIVINNTVSLTLPLLANVGDVVRVTLSGTGNWTVNQNAGQSIVFGHDTTIVGTGGSLNSTALGNTVEILCYEVNTGFIVLSSIGNINLV